MPTVVKKVKYYTANVDAGIGWSNRMTIIGSGHRYSRWYKLDWLLEAINRRHSRRKVIAIDEAAQAKSPQGGFVEKLTTNQQVGKKHRFR
jgi:hypothetical protein